jgi:DNA polymerase III subunit chi
MAQIDFYLLPGNDLSGLMLFCSRLCEKACEQHLRVHVQTSDSLETEALDEALWSFRPESFLPHMHAAATEQIIEPISFSHAANALAGTDQPDLVLLTQPILPSGWSANVRTALLINNDERILQASRWLYKKLTQEGHTLNTHDLRKR